MENLTASRLGGFTLIELLVVVLIIGILAAVALPQYQVAVLKARSMRLLPLLRSISDAENVYFLANNTYSLDFSELDIEMPAGATVEAANKLTYNDFSCFLRKGAKGDEQASAYCNDTREKAPQIEKYFVREYFICWGGSGEIATKVCKSISGKTTADSLSGTSGIKTGFSF